MRAYIQLCTFVQQAVPVIPRHGLYQEQAGPQPGGPRVPQDPHALRREHDQGVVQGLQAGLSQRPADPAQVCGHVQVILPVGQRRAVL